MTLMGVLLQASAGDSMMSTVVMMVAVIAIFYFFMIRPQQKKQKALQEARAAIKVGDKVVTAGGIHGRVKEVNDISFLIEIADNVRIKVDKGSVYIAPEDAAIK